MFSISFPGITGTPEQCSAILDTFNLKGMYYNWTVENGVVTLNLYEPEVL